jgi:cell division protein FtsZ
MRSGRAAPVQADLPAAATFASQQSAADSIAAFPEPIESTHETDESATLEFIPPAPEQPMARAPRMPQIEDLPQVAQNQLRALREAQNALPAPETRRRSLLEKLAAFGITRHDEEPAPAQVPAAPVASVTPLQRPHVAAPPEPIRPQQRAQPARPLGALDPNGRALPRPPASEDDHLDIPAFLRRQQN